MPIALLCGYQKLNPFEPGLGVRVPYTGVVKNNRLKTNFSKTRGEKAAGVLHCPLSDSVRITHHTSFLKLRNGLSFGDIFGFVLGSQLRVDSWLCTQEYL